jgi:hypothetical protein
LTMSYQYASTTSRSAVVSPMPLRSESHFVTSGEPSPPAG